VRSAAPNPRACHFDWTRVVTDGIALPVPPTREFRRTVFLWLIAGGPVVSVAVTLAWWLIFLEHGSGVRNWMGTFFWTSAVGLLSLIPMSSGLNKSDAARILMFLTKPDQARAWIAAVAVQAENLRGVRPREWSNQLVEEMMLAKTEKVFPRLMAFFRELDLGNAPGALEHLEIALADSARVGKQVRHVLFLTAAEACAQLKWNADVARQWQQRALKLRKRGSAAPAAVAIAMCEDRFEDALREVSGAGPCSPAEDSLPG
jgi:hypothetical protein